MAATKSPALERGKLHEFNSLLRCLEEAVKRTVKEEEEEEEEEDEEEEEAKTRSTKTR